jgi:dipeptidyl aminopeptidase/acylaminoacyl peptidase
MEKVTVPLLVIMGRLDRLIPPEDAVRMVAEAGKGAELWMFEDGNHVNNNIPYKHRPQQADWMREKLGLLKDSLHSSNGSTGRAHLPRSGWARPISAYPRDGS